MPTIHVPEGVSTASSSNSKPTASINTLRPCSFCKNLKVPTVSKFKLCLDCRIKFRNAARKNREGKRKVPAAMNKQQVNGYLELGRMGQTSIKRSVICTEYQTYNELFETLKFLNLSTYSSRKNTSGQALQFQGSYTIVTAPDIDNLQRVWLLSNELRAKAWLSFQLKPLSVIGDESSQTLCFACTCVENVTAPGLASTESHGRNGENVFATTSTDDSSIKADLCGGLITLKAIVDNTHLLGIPGQHIVVRVEHPVAKSPARPLLSKW